MSKFILNANGIAELRRAVRRNPRKTVSEISKFLTRGIAAYNRQIIRRPWKIGQRGGGAPVDTGNLRDTHRREMLPFEARIYPTAPYAEAVHKGLTARHPRPWLDYAKQEAEPEIERLSDTMLHNIVRDLAR